MSDSEYMGMDGDDHLETDYLQGVTSLGETLDQSTDSLTSQLTLPSFTVDQSAGLQGSQGFQVLGLNRGCRDFNPALWQHGAGQLPVCNSSSTDQQFVSIQQPAVHSDNIPLGYQVMDGNLLVQNMNSSGETASNFSTLVLQSTGFNPVVSGSYKPREILPHPLVQVGAVKQEVGVVDQSSGCHGDSGGGSSDEKSGQSNNTSPRKRGKKGSTSTAGSNDQDSGMDVCSGVKYEPVIDTPTSATDPGLTPSLEDILTEKKMALLRSPEVMEFLRQQQQRVVNEKQGQSGGMES